MNSKKDQIYISMDKSKLDVEMIQDFLSRSYWARGRSLEEVQRSIEHSICFGLYKEGSQIGFARVISDRLAFAYIMDVFVLEEKRGKGYANLLMEEILNYPPTKNVKKWFLGTKDAVFLYEKFGFKKVSGDITWMQKQRDTHE